MSVWINEVISSGPEHEISIWVLDEADFDRLSGERLPLIRLRVFNSLFFGALLSPFAISITKEFEMRPHQDCIFHKFFHSVNYPFPEASVHQTLIVRLAFVRKLRIRSWYRRLIRGSEHAHPAAEDTEGVHDVKTLRASAYL